MLVHEDRLQSLIRESVLVREQLGNPPDPPRSRWLINGRLSMRWKRGADGLVVDEWTPEAILERNERLAWLMQNRKPWKLVNGHLIADQSEIDRTNMVAELLSRAMHLGRGQSKQMLRELGLGNTLTAAEGSYGALGAYPLQNELAAVTPTTTEAGLIAAANAQIYTPIPQNGVLAPQAYRFVVAGRATTSVTAANYTWTPRLGNTNAAPSLGASLALAKTISLTNAIFVWKGDITIQQVGPPGANAKAMGHFTMHLNSAVGGAAIVWEWGSIAQASFDSTVAPPGATGTVSGGQLWLGTTASAAAADTFTTGQIHYMDWN